MKKVEYRSNTDDQFKNMFDHLSIEKLIKEKNRLEKFGSDQPRIQAQIKYIETILDKAEADTIDIFDQWTDEEMEEMREDYNFDKTDANN